MLLPLLLVDDHGKDDDDHHSHFIAFDSSSSSSSSPNWQSDTTKCASQLINCTCFTRLALVLVVPFTIVLATPLDPFRRLLAGAFNIVTHIKWLSIWMTSNCVSCLALSLSTGGSFNQLRLASGTNDLYHHYYCYYYYYRYCFPCCFCFCFCCDSAHLEANLRRPAAYCVS